MSADKLLTVLDGEQFSDAQVASVLPWLIFGMAQSADLAKLPVEEQVAIGDLFSALGIGLDDDVEAMLAVAATWPAPDPALLKGLNVAVRELLAERGPGGAADAVKRLLGDDRVQGALERTAPPPKGAVAGGPMARFAALAALGSKERGE